MTKRAAKPAASPATAQDGLTNALTGAGTTVDRAVHHRYALRFTDAAQLEQAYRSSWLPRKIVNIPAEDMTASWRDWQAEADDITKLEAAEAALHVQHKVTRALILARLFGGAAIIIGLRDNAPSQPLPAVIREGDLAYLHVVNRQQISHGALETNITSPFFGEPTNWTLARQSIHPSRVIPFQGVQIPEGSLIGGTSTFWGDSVLQAAMDAVQNADLAQAGFADLINEAKVDVINIPDLMTNVVSEAYERKLMTRLQLAATAKSIHRALVLDGNETWSQRQISWAGMPDMIRAYLELVAGAADIPLTRLLGTTPGGLQSTGKGEEKNYLQMLESQRGGMLRRALQRLDAVLVPSALGKVPDGLHFTWPSLIQQDEKADAETEKMHSDMLVNAVNAGLVSADVAAGMFKGRVIERGHWPGAEMAYDEADAAGAAMPGDDDDDTAMNDAAPRSLYVSRPVLNRGELQAWATAQGLGELQDDLHVTIAHSRQPLDWMRIESDWNQDTAGQITIAPGGVRIVEPLGSKTAVLLFTSSHLSWRHQGIINAGASHDYPDYQPHISLTEAPVDLAGIEPYQGRIILGPERFEELRMDA